MTFEEALQALTVKSKMLWESQRNPLLPQEKIHYTNYIRNTSSLRNPQYDCSEIAEDIARLLNIREAVCITPVNNNGFTTFKVLEYGKVEEYVNHYVIVYKGLVYDPRLVDYPIEVNDYFNFLVAMNPTVPLKWGQEEIV